jgi:rfaE bifunctional protein kinase chain/domain/rfaE bifunctional protein nucleotidyltransferase chain/domain
MVQSFSWSKVARMNPTTASTVRGDIPAPAKIVELDQISEHVERLRAAGKRIVHCHGVFDLLHIGHIRHLQEAKQLGDILVVSLTCDAFVNKGPHRPAFTESLRAEALAALTPIDLVTVSRFPSAIEAIEAIRPNIYVKGPDYRATEKDITGGISREREAVERYGGTIHFTDGETFSSSSLLNRHVQTLPKHVEEYLMDFRANYTARDVFDVLDRLRDLHITVVGETIIDEYVDCDQMGKSAKEPVLAMRYNGRERFAGGAIAVANHLASFVKSVSLLTYLGTDNPQEDFVREHLKPNVDLKIVYKANSPTIVKQRFIETYLRNKLFEVYYINDDILAAGEETALCNLIDSVVPASDMILAADFGHGLLTPRSIQHLVDHQKFLAVNTQINAANIRFHAVSSYGRADYICINENELRLDARNRHEDLEKLAVDLSKRLRCDRILVTRGKTGVEYFADHAKHSAPSLALTVVDRVGSGDAVLAITSAAVSIGAPPPMVAFLANVIGAQKVQIVGNKSSIDRVATLKFIESLLK